MGNMRHFCDEEGNEHALVMPIVEVRDNLGALAVQVLAARYDLNQMSYTDMIDKLYDIVCELHSAYDDQHTRIAH